MVGKDKIVKQLEAKLEELEQQFLSEKANEVTEARNAIINVLKEREVSLPAAVFACDLVKMELMRAQLEEFMGHVKIPQGSLPIVAKPPIEAV